MEWLMVLEGGMVDGNLFGWWRGWFSRVREGRRFETLSMVVLGV
jgi:hypothetical protein